MGVALVGYAEGTLPLTATNLRAVNLDGCTRKDGSVCISARVIHFARDPDAGMLGCALRQRPISVATAASCPYAGR